MGGAALPQIKLVLDITQATCCDGARCSGVWVVGSLADVWPRLSGLFGQSEKIACGAVERRGSGLGPLEATLSAVLVQSGVQTPGVWSVCPCRRPWPLVGGRVVE